MTEKPGTDRGRVGATNLLHTSDPGSFVELEHLYKTAPVGLALLDRELRYIRINDRLAEINGKKLGSAHSTFFRNKETKKW